MANKTIRVVRVTFSDGSIALELILIDEYGYKVSYATSYYQSDNEINIVKERLIARRANSDLKRKKPQILEAINQMRENEPDHRIEQTKKFHWNQKQN